MKTAKLIELERGRIDLMDEARDLLRQMDGETDTKKLDELGRKHDAAMRSLDLNKLDQDEEILIADDEEARAARRPGSNGEASGTDGGNAIFGIGSDWVDKRGEPVRVLARDQKISERSSSGLSLGDMVRAKILGPRNESEKRALSEGTDSAGGFTVPTPLASQFIDLMRAKSVAVRAGAMTVPMESETLAIARLASDPTVGWRAENAAIIEGDPTFDRVTFTAHTLAGRISLSRELMEDSLNVGAMIENAFAQSMALELDRAAIWGDGTGNSPTGIVNTAGINTVSMGTNGAALTSYDKLIDAVYEMQLDNADDPTAMIMHPRTQAALAKLKDANLNPLTVPDMIARIPRLATTAAPIDEEEGTATDASSIVFGNYRDLLIGVRHQLEFRLFDSPLATTGEILAVAWMRADVQLARPNSFAPLTGVIPA
jgi:HK97 family phage major capsid protein